MRFALASRRIRADVEPYATVGLELLGENREVRMTGAAV